MKPTQQLLSDALDQAVTQQFCELFGVLLSAVGDDAEAQAAKRFEAGLLRLGKAETAVRQVIKKM
jgi:hypothetical protein